MVSGRTHILGSMCSGKQETYQKTVVCGDRDLICFEQVTVKWDVTGEQGSYKMGAVAEAPASGGDDSVPASVDDLLVRET